MENEFVSYTQALALKELGFDEPVIAMYKEEFKKDLYPTKYWSKDNRNSMWIEGVISAPTYSQAFRWFREKYKLKADIIHAKSNGGYTYTIWKWNFDNSIGNWERIGVVNSWLTYEEAELACLFALINIVKKQNLQG
jgi:hypothetical protein